MTSSYTFHEITSTTYPTPRESTSVSIKDAKSIRYQIFKYLGGLTLLSLLLINILSRGNNGSDFFLEYLSFTIIADIILPSILFLLIMLFVNQNTSSQEGLSDFRSTLPYVISIIMVTDSVFCMWILVTDTSGWAALAVLGINIYFAYPIELVVFLVYLLIRKRHKKFNR